MEDKKSKIKSFTDLTAWKESHKLAITVYKVTEKFPETEKFGLVSQMRRAAVSVSSNIAEGFSRLSVKDKYKFYIMAYGSLTELQNQLLLARDLDYLSKEKFNEVASQSIISAKLINGLKKIKNSVLSTKYNIRNTKYQRGG